MAQENIKLTKTIYSTKSADGLVDRSFSEFFKTKDPVNVDRFFSIYGELFYDIPKEGEKSHASVIKQSQDYRNNYYDERDDTITTLTERIIELEEQLNKPTEEHPFFKNGTLISIANEENKPTWGKIHYMDKGKKRFCQSSDVFYALVASLGFPNGSKMEDIVKPVPQIIFDGISNGPKFELRDITGQTAAEELEEQLNIISSTTVNNWGQELRDIIQPIEDGSMSSQISYINSLKSKINSEYTREASLESQNWKYHQDMVNGYTQEDISVAQKLYEISRPKLIKSRQTLAILARIWDKRTNFPNIDFDSILPTTLSSGTEAILDKNGNTQVSNPLTDNEVGAFGGGDKGRYLFPGVLEGGEYIVTESGSTTVTENSEGYLNIGEKSDAAYSLLDEGKIKIIYDKENYIAFRGWISVGLETSYSHDPSHLILERYTFRGYKYK